MAKVGDKYIIEIEEVFRRNGAPQIARIKGFNTLVFDKCGLEKLEPYDGGEKVYCKGYVDGINAVVNEYEDKQKHKNIVSRIPRAKIITNGNCLICGKELSENRLFLCKECEKKQDAEIKVGDEVYSDAFDNKGIVTHITADKVACVCIICNGSTMMKVGLCGLRKTGRHFPQIIEVLEQMKGEADGK